MTQKKEDIAKSLTKNLMESLDKTVKEAKKNFSSFGEYKPKEKIFKQIIDVAIRAKDDLRRNCPID